MNTNQIITSIGLLVALASTFAADAFAYWALVLVALGLINGFINPMADAATRMAFTLAAFAMPTLANNLDVIPVIGAPVNNIIDQLMIMIAGAVVANLMLVIKDNVLPSGE